MLDPLTLGLKAPQWDTPLAHAVLTPRPTTEVLWVGTGVQSVAEVTIAAGAVATLNATPVELVAAPGAGKAIVVDEVQWWLDFGSTAYDAAASGDTLVAKYTNGSGAAVVDTVAGDTFGGASADAYAVARGASVAPVANAAVVAHINTGEWYGAAGDSPVKARIRYRTLDLTW